MRERGERASEREIYIYRERGRKREREVEKEVEGEVVCVVPPVPK